MKEKDNGFQCLMQFGDEFYSNFPSWLPVIPNLQCNSSKHILLFVRNYSMTNITNCNFLCSDVNKVNIGVVSDKS